MWPFSSRPAEESQLAIPTSTLTTDRLENSSSFQTQAHDQPRSSNSTSLLQDPDVLKWKGQSGERLGVPVWARVPLMMGASGICGLALGAAKGGPITGDRYRAENAHRFPVSRSGWYLYHKTKNYHIIVGSAKEGVKFGLGLMVWATLFGVTEEMIDRSRARLFASREEDEDRISGQRDAISTVMAALTVAGAYSWKSGFDHYAAARMSKMAIKYSLIYGLAQDLLASLRGDRPAYVSWMIGKTTGKLRKSETI